MKKILILNRRCLKNSQSGGAEIYTYHLCKALLQISKEVIWLASKENNLEFYEEIYGIKFIRKGNELTTHFYGFVKANFNNFDLIIDEFNGIGYFTFFKKNSILLIHQLYDKFWNAEFGFWGNFFKIFEKFLLKFYKNKITITVSKSTYEDLIKMGFKNVYIIPNGLDITPLKELPKKNDTLSLGYLGRLKKTKNPEDAIKAFFEIKKRIKEVQLYIMGNGPLYSNLKSKYSDFENIIFLGYVDEKKKYEILKKIHFLLVPSIIEGWGQVVIQANAMGTPVIGYNTKGLKDSIKNGVTGYLVKNYNEMASKVIELFNNKEIYSMLCKNAISHAKKFSWRKTEESFINFFKKINL